MRSMRWLFAALFSVAMVSTAGAATTYYYTNTATQDFGVGAPGTLSGSVTLNCSPCTGITGEYAITSPLFLDLELLGQNLGGTQQGSLAQTEPASFFDFANGVITAWDIAIQDNLPWGLETCNAPLSPHAPNNCPVGASIDGVYINNQGSSVTGHPGTWAVSAVPEPASAVVLTAGLLSLAAVRRRSRHT